MEIDIAGTKVEVTLCDSFPPGYGIYVADIMTGYHIGCQDYGGTAREAVVNVFRKSLEDI